MESASAHDIQVACTSFEENKTLPAFWALCLYEGSPGSGRFRQCDVPPMTHYTPCSIKVLIFLTHFCWCLCLLSCVWAIELLLGPKYRFLPLSLLCFILIYLAHHLRVLRPFRASISSSVYSLPIHIFGKHDRQLMLTRTRLRWGPKPMSCLPPWWQLAERSLKYLS